MLRRLIVVILMLGMAGTGAELLLLEHTEDLWQWTPLVLFAVALPVAGWLLLAPGAANCSGLSDPDAGLRCFGFRRPVAPLPGKSRVRSRDASIRHPLELVRDALGGATPTLAPGTMTLFGLLGLVACLRHPKLEAADRAKAPREET